MFQQKMSLISLSFSIHKYWKSRLTVKLCYRELWFLQGIYLILQGFLSIYFAFLSVCIQKSSKRPNGPKFFVGPPMTTEKAYERSELQKYVSKILNFRKVLKIHVKNCKSVKFEIEQQLKIEIEDSLILFFFLYI